MLALADADLSDDANVAALEQYLDIDGLIDWMLIHQYMSNYDGPCCFEGEQPAGHPQTSGGRPIPLLCVGHGVLAVDGRRRGQRRDRRRRARLPRLRPPAGQRGVSGAVRCARESAAHRRRRPHPRRDRGPLRGARR
ncbi:MAG: hypothetical protein IPG17_27225 [Sandaracinaceae bacterium]|nr:hypothetical protein [Sandaracinaceae bacterium]